MALGSRAFDVLLTLALNRHRVLSQGELMHAVWPGLVVECNNLQVHISALRKLLGSGVIDTVARRGYRFTARLDGEPAGLAPAAAAAMAQRSPIDKPAAPAKRGAVHHFDGLEIHPDAGLVVIGGQVHILRPQAMAVLMALVELGPQPVANAELLQRVWPGKAMAENNLQGQVAVLRKLLGPTMIATIPGRGYLFNTRRPVAAKQAPETPSWLQRDGGVAGGRTTLYWLLRAIEITLTQELANHELALHCDPVLLQSVLLQLMAGHVSKLARGRGAAAAGQPDDAMDLIELADTLVKLGAGLVVLGQRAQALSCLEAAAALWSRAGALALRAPTLLNQLSAARQTPLPPRRKHRRRLRRPGTPAGRPAAAGRPWPLRRHVLRRRHRWQTPKSRRPRAVRPQHVHAASVTPAPATGWGRAGRPH